MTDERGKTLFVNLFIQIHILSIGLSTAVFLIFGTFYALISYLIFLHGLAGLVYLLDLKSLRPDYLLERLTDK